MYICEERRRHAFYVLVLTILVLFMVIKKTGQHDANGLMVLTPVILWIFFMAHIEAKQLYYGDTPSLPPSPPVVETPVQQPPIDYNCRDNIAEPFQVW